MFTQSTTSFNESTIKISSLLLPLFEHVFCYIYSTWLEIFINFLSTKLIPTKIDWLEEYHDTQMLVDCSGNWTVRSYCFKLLNPLLHKFPTTRRYIPRWTTLKWLLVSSTCNSFYSDATLLQLFSVRFPSMRFIGSRPMSIT